MATFYAEGKVDFMILIDDSKNARITEKCLLYMFGFQCGFIHVSRDDVYDDNSVAQNNPSLRSCLVGDILVVVHSKYALNFNITSLLLIGPFGW
jgi:hypothetical protein